MRKLAPMTNTTEEEGAMKRDDQWTQSQNCNLKGNRNLNEDHDLRTARGRSKGSLRLLETGGGEEIVDNSRRNSGGIVRDLEVQIVGAVCNLQSYQLCLTLIDPHTHYNPILVKKPQTSSRRINDLGIISACHYGAEYETEYSASIETHTTTSIDSAHQKSTDTPQEESVDSSPDDWENDYFNPIMAVNDAPPETPDDLYDEEYQKKGILVYKFRPLKPEIQAQVETYSLLAEACGNGTRFAESVKYTDKRRLTERYRNRSTKARRNRSMLTCHHRSTDVQNSAEEPLTFLEPENSIGKTKMSKKSTEMIRDVQEIWMDTSLISFTQTKLVPEIYTNDEINEIFYGVCGTQEKYESDFQMNLDGVYHPLNDSIGWLTTCMEEMRQDIARIQHATDVSHHTSIDKRQHASIDSRLTTSIDQRLPASVDNNPPPSSPMKSP
ncbi:hypothetical protein DY000_02049951 [Brassica cretica]|uniref:Uncharacterized protein n=1 Tax=Brassica cretica TaxID=69181 RepID=A0ABQ7ES53_BRACR|nr:hypothetical protein DY000_02049951 [Brassica cretica]